MRDPGSQKMTRRTRPHLALARPSPVLITESKDEFSRRHQTLKDEIKPHGAIEEFRVDEIAALMWEIRRYRRAKTALINSAFRRALESLLERVCRQPGESVYDIEEDVEELAHQWFGDDQSAKQLILEKFAYFDLDEHAVEAEAMRIMAPDLENFDRALTSRERRLDKALVSFAEFRAVFGLDLRATAERVIDGEVLALGNASNKRPPAAA